MAEIEISIAGPNAQPSVLRLAFSPTFQEALNRWKEAYRAYAADETDDAAITKEEQAAEDALMAVPTNTAAEFAAKMCVFTRWGVFTLTDESPLLAEAIQLCGLQPCLSEQVQ